jgi:hypothetical protein
LSKRQAGVWAGKLVALGFDTRRCVEADDTDEGESAWSVWCSDTEQGGSYFYEPADCRGFLRWAESQGLA